MPVMMMLSRAVRKVPLDWQHPKEDHGYGRGAGFRPLLAGSYADAAAEWESECAAFERGEYPDYMADDNRAEAIAGTLTFEDYHGAAPIEDDYMPAFGDWPPLGICMYEEVTEGTPISPVYEDTPEGRQAMADYLAGQSGYVTDGMTSADWLAVIHGGLGLKDIHTGEVEVHGGDPA